MTAQCQISPTQLSALIKSEHALDIEEFPAFINSKLGQQIQTITETGEWAAELAIEIIGYSKFKFKWNKPFNRNKLLDWAFRWWAIERIESRVHLKLVKTLSDQIKDLHIPSNSTSPVELIYQWALQSISHGVSQNSSEQVTAIKCFYLWCIEEEIPFFDEHRADSLSSHTFPSAGNKQLVSLIDPISGPYCRNELSEIERALNATDNLTREKAIYYLCRDWGLRPIQLALLREQDYGEDDAGKYIYVTSAKGVVRAPMRREKNNMVKRYLSPEASHAIDELILFNVTNISAQTQRLVDLKLVDAESAKKLPRPLFCGGKSIERAKSYLSDNALRPYTLHTDSMAISRIFRSLTGTLSIEQKRKTNNINHDLLEIGCYRLRRTKGTSMVLNGASPSEVAEALDHQSLDSIKHYFKFNSDLIDYVNQAHSSSEELKSAAQYWSGKLTSNKKNAHEIERKVSDLGVCKRKTTCPHHPTVTCYTCHKFEPFIEADHQKAKNDIVQHINFISQNSTGPVQHQLDEALAGVNAVIMAIKNEN